MEKDNAYYSELACRAVSSDAAFRELYEKYFPVVYNLVYMRVRNSATADELTSEIFLKVVKNLATFDKTKASFATWISRITERTCIDFYRRNSKREEVEWDDTFSPPIAEHDQPEQKFFLNENKKLLLQALSSLSEREQKIIELKFWANMSNVEIAETLDLTPTNVGIILFRAMGTLRKKLKDRI